MLFGSVPHWHHSEVSLGPVWWASSPFSCRSPSNATRVRSKYVQLRHEPRCPYTILCNSALEPLCDLPNTFQFLGDLLHGRVSEGWGFSFPVEPCTSSNYISVLCQVVGGQGKKKQRQFPSWDHKCSLRKHSVLGSCPVPTTSTPCRTNVGTVEAENK